MTRLPLWGLFWKGLSVLFWPSEALYPLAEVFQRENIGPHPCFLFLYLYFYYLFFLYQYIFVKHWFLDLQTGRSVEYSFLWLGSQVLLMCFLFREDIGSISVFWKSCEYFTLADIWSMCMNNIVYPAFPLLNWNSSYHKLRTVIEPFLYKKCVCVQNVWTYYPLYKAERWQIIRKKYNKKREYSIIQK